MLIKNHGGLMKKGFTLAEVLITLGIIGVVAALTLPVLFQNYQEQEIVAKAKKDYSLLAQALQLAQVDFDTPGDNSSLYLYANNNTTTLAKAFSKYISGGQLCLYNSSEPSCADLPYKLEYADYKNGYGQNFNGPAIKLPDGGIVFFSISGAHCEDTEMSGANVDENGNRIFNEDGSPSMWHGIRNECGNIYFDVNGSKKPNKFGQDAFGFGVYKNNIGNSTWNAAYGDAYLKNILKFGKRK